VGTDAGAEALSRGTALSAPLLPLLVLGVSLNLLWRGALRTGAALLSLVAVAMLIGSLGEAFAPATADNAEGRLMISGAIGIVMCAIVLTGAVAAWRSAGQGRMGDPAPADA
jgi:hypothetical protein